MAKTRTNTEEIIEKKESSPVATTSLIVSCVAMILAMVFCVVEIMQYREGLNPRLARSESPGSETASRDTAALKKRVDDILNDQHIPGGDGGMDDADDADDGDLEDEEDAEDDMEEDADLEEEEDADLEEEDADL